MSDQLKAFERNRYFYGKLLTVRDFEAEQSYGMNKQRLVNRLLHGSGVVCGLEIQQESEDRIRIRPGVALDCFGREIVVPKDHVADQIVPSSAVNCGDADKTQYYIYLEYHERDKEPIPGVADASSCEEVCQSNRIQEGFKVRVEPSKYPKVPCVVCSDRTVIYEKQGLRLIRLVPRWVKPNDVFTVKLELHVDPSAKDFNEKGEPINLEENPDEKHLINLNPENDKISIPAPNKNGLVWEHSYIVQAGDTKGKTKISSIITIGSEKIPADQTVSEIEITNESINRKMTEEAYSAVNGCCTCGKGEYGVLIGTITVNADGKIIEVDGKTERDYVYTNPLLYDLHVKAESRAGQLPPYKSLQKVFSGLVSFKQMIPGEKRVSDKISYPILTENPVWVSLELELGDDKRIGMGECSDLQQNYYPLLTVVHSSLKKKFQIIVEDRRKNSGQEEGKKLDWCIRWFAMPVTELVEDRNVEPGEEIVPLLEQKIITLLTLSEPLVLAEIIERVGGTEEEIKPALEQLVQNKELQLLTSKKYTINDSK